MVGLDLSGTVLDGRYRLVSLLGAGGMGQIYEGLHFALGRRVAIKVLPDELSKDDRFRARFAREARSAAKVTHRNVVQILDFGESPQRPVYFVMEFLEGRDLRALLRETGRLPWPRARHLLLQAVGALKAAHAHGIIHRDIKPGNCFVVDLPQEGLTDVVKLLDFGIAKVLDGTQLTQLTESEVLGTAWYMAPEQAQGEQLDARSDVYSLGIMAYEMLAGRVPFTGTTFANVVARHLFERPEPLHRLVPDILPGVEAFVLRCLAKEPANRFASMADVETALLAVPSVSIDSVRTRVQWTSGVAERIDDVRLASGDGRPGSPTVVLREPQAKVRVDEDSFEDAVTPDPMILRPRFGEPFPLQSRVEGERARPAEADEASATPERVGSVEHLGHEPDEPSEALPTPVRLVPSLENEPSEAQPTPVELATASESPMSNAGVSGTQAVPGRSVSGAPSEQSGSNVASIGAYEAADSSAELSVLPSPLLHEDDNPEPGEAQSLGSPTTRSRGRFLGVLTLLGAGAAVASVLMVGEPAEMTTSAVEREPIAARKLGSVVVDAPADAVPSEVTKPEETESPTNAEPPAGVEGPTATESKPAIQPNDAAVDSNEEGAPDPPTADAQPSAPPATPASKPHETAKCRERRREAEIAERAGVFVDVVWYTSFRSCWPPKQQLERLRMRQNALSETKRYKECIAAGRGVADPRMKTTTEWCERRLDQQKG